MSELTGGDIAAVASELSSESMSTDASPASDPETVDPSTPTTADAIDPTSEDDPDLSTDPANAGPIPFDRHKAALDNARTKARDEALTEWRAQYGWAEQVPREQLENWSDTAAQMHADPVGFLQRFAAELQSHPVYGPQLKSAAARTLGARTAPDDVRPQPDLRTEDGTAVYSAERMAELDAWKERQWEKKVNEQLAPLKETHAEMQQQRQFELIHQASDQFAERELSSLKKLPHYETYKAEIRAEFANMPPPDHPLGYATQLRDAYLKVVIPNLSKRERAQAMADMQTRGSASTASPSRPSASSPVPDSKRELSDLLAEGFAAARG